MNREVVVRAPSRLHFGMFGFGGEDKPEFGGVGMMVSPPSVTVSISSAERFQVTGKLNERTKRCAREFFRRRRMGATPTLAIEVQEAPPEHCGLGTGTQLSLAIVRGLACYFCEREMSAEELACCAGRGQRSAVGTHGFVHGGLIIERGRTGASLGQLEMRCEVPAAWRVLLIRPALEPGKSGQEETQAFRRLSPVPSRVTAELRRIAHEQLLPELDRGDCGAFGEAVYEFGLLAGECFADVQGGAFASREIANLVDRIRAFGVPGAGQSSWGPTVFAVTRDQQHAEALAEYLQEAGPARVDAMTVAEPNNVGAVVASG